MDWKIEPQRAGMIYKDPTGLMGRELKLEPQGLIARGFRGSSVVKSLPANTGDTGSIPRSRSPGEGNGNPLQYSCLQNPMDRGAWWVTVHGVAKSQTQLSN